VHDGAPAHFMHNVREHCNVRETRYLIKNGPVAWPLRFPDLNLLDFVMGIFEKYSVFFFDK